MMRCRMTTCGTFTFEGKSRALPVTVTRCLRNIFRCRSARHWRGSVVMLNGDLWFNRGYRFNFCCDFSDDWRGRLSNNFRFSNHNLSSFGNFFNICRLFLRFNHRFCVFCDFRATATSDSVITCGCSVTAAAITSGCVVSTTSGCGSATGTGLLRLQPFLQQLAR